MSAAQYEEGLRLEADRRAQADRERQEQASAKAQADALAKGKQASTDYYNKAKETVNHFNNPSLLNAIAQGSTKQATNDLNTQFGQQRERLVSEQGALGRLTQPAAQYNIGQAEQGYQRSLGDTIAKIQQQNLAGQQGMNQNAMQSLLSAQNQAENVGFQQQGIPLSEAQNLRQIDLENRKALQEQTLASYLGRLQAEANEPGAMDYLNTGLGAVQTGAMLYAASDIKTKKNLSYVKTDKNGVVWYDFEYKNDEYPELPKGTQRGVIAQEVMVKFPDAVKDNGKYLTVDYSKLLD